MGGILHGKIGLFPKAPDDLPPVRYRTAVTDQIEVTAARTPPGVGAVQIVLDCFAVAVLPDTGLAQVVPGRPAEVPISCGSFSQSFQFS